MRKFLVATVALMVAVATSVSLDGVDRSQSKMLLQHVKRDTDTCQGLGDKCKNPMSRFMCYGKGAACVQQDCCEGLACTMKGDWRKGGVCKKDYMDYDNKCTKAGGHCVKKGGIVCQAVGCEMAPCCKGLTCSSKVCK